MENIILKLKTLIKHKIFYLHRCSCGSIIENDLSKEVDAPLRYNWKIESFIGRMIPLYAHEFILFLFFILIQACNSIDEHIYEFNPVNLKERTILLSEIADEIKYICLDNNFSIELLTNRNMQLINNELYISIRGTGILLFDRSGKFIRKIGSIGIGPEEYVYHHEFTINDLNGTVYVYDIDNKVKVFSRTGHFVRSFSIDKDERGTIDDIKFFNSMLLITFPMLKEYNKYKYKWILYDTLGNIIKKQDRRTPVFSANFYGPASTYKIENRLSYWSLYIDTVFSILPDLSEKPNFIITSGEHRWPRKKLSVEQIVGANYLTLLNIFETKRYLVINYSYQKKQHLLLYDKQKGENFLFCSKKSPTGTIIKGIENDLDGGLSFLPEIYYQEKNKEYLIGVQQPYQIINHVSSSSFKNYNPKYPEKKKELEKLANALKETDNPVLMLVRLKK